MNRDVPNNIGHASQDVIHLKKPLFFCMRLILNPVFNVDTSDIDYRRIQLKFSYEK